MKKKPKKIKPVLNLSNKKGLLESQNWQIEFDKGEVRCNVLMRYCPTCGKEIEG